MKRLFIFGLVLAVGGCVSLPQMNDALLWAVKSGDIAAVQRLLDSGADVNTTGHETNYGSTLLMIAIMDDSADIANLLISRGADVGFKDKYGDTPLHLAIKKSMSSTVQALVNKGADVNAKGALDDSPLHLAMYKGMDDLSAMLKRKGADEELLNRYGLRPSDMVRLPGIEAKIKNIARLLDNGGNWTDRQAARTQFEHLKTLPVNELINALVLQTIEQASHRPQVLILAIKLGITGSEQKLSDLLMVYGDKSMAEDYLNSGSHLLEEAGRKWADEKGYNIGSGRGSHRGSWGGF